MNTKEGREPQEIRVGLSAEERRKMYYQQMEQKNRQKILKQTRRRKKWRRFWHGKLPWLAGILLLTAAAAGTFFLLRGGGEKEEYRASVCYADSSGSLYMQGNEEALISGNHELLASDPSYSRFLILKDGSLYETEAGRENRLAEQVDALDVSFDENLNVAAWCREEDMTYQLYVWKRETGQIQAAETGAPYLNTVCVSRDGKYVAYAVQEPEGQNRIKIFDTDSGQAAAAVEDAGYLSCYYVAENELIYYSLSQNQLYYLKNGQQVPLGQNVQDVMVFPEAGRLVYRDTEADVKLADYKNGSVSSVGKAEEVYTAEKKTAARTPEGVWKVSRISRRTVSYGDGKELFLVGEGSTTALDIQTGESGTVLTGAAPEVMYLTGDGERLYWLAGKTLRYTEKTEGKWQPDAGVELSASCDSFTLAGKQEKAVWLEGTELYTQGSEAKKLVADSVKKISDSRGGRGLAYLQGSSLYYLEEPGASPLLLTDGADVALAPAVAEGMVYYRGQDRSLRRISTEGKDGEKIAEDVTEYYLVWPEKGSAG